MPQSTDRPVSSAEWANSEQCRQSIGIQRRSSATGLLLVGFEACEEFPVDRKLQAFATFTGGWLSTEFQINSSGMAMARS